MNLKRIPGTFQSVCLSHNRQEVQPSKDIKERVTLPQSGTCAVTGLQLLCCHLIPPFPLKTHEFVCPRLVPTLSLHDSNAPQVIRKGCQAQVNS